jgi:sigma-B regulation protein RsbQ
MFREYDPIQNNAVTVTGKLDAAATMVFIPGFGTDQSVWGDVAGAFADAFRTVLLDNAGTGRSLREYFIQSHYPNLNAYADDVLDL